MLGRGEGGCSADRDKRGEGGRGGRGGRGSGRSGRGGAGKASGQSQQRRQPAPFHPHQATDNEPASQPPTNQPTNQTPNNRTECRHRQTDKQTATRPSLSPVPAQTQPVSPSIFRLKRPRYAGLLGWAGRAGLGPPTRAGELWGGRVRRSIDWRVEGGWVEGGRWACVGLC